MVEKNHYSYLPTFLTWLNGPFSYSDLYSCHRKVLWDKCQAGCQSWLAKPQRNKNPVACAWMLCVDSSKGYLLSPVCLSLLCQMHMCAEHGSTPWNRKVFTGTFSVLDTVVHKNCGWQNRDLPMADSLPQGPEAGHEVSIALLESMGDNSPASPLWMSLFSILSEKSLWNFEMHNLDGKHKQKIQRLIINNFFTNYNSYKRSGR